MRDNGFFLINCEVCSSGVLPMCDTCTLMLCFVFVSGRNEMVSVWVIWICDPDCDDVFRYHG